MTWWGRLFGRKRLEREMDSELRFHLDAFTEDLVRAGVPLDEARRRARIEFGGLESIKEECRQARGLRFVDELRQDLRKVSDVGHRHSIVKYLKDRVGVALAAEHRHFIRKTEISSVRLTVLESHICDVRRIRRERTNLRLNPRASQRS